MSTLALSMALSGMLWLGYVFAGYPVLLVILGRVRRARPVIREDVFPFVSVLISARNEEKDIGWKIAETLNWDYPADCLEVLVASDASEDATDAIIKRIQDPRVTLVRMERRCGKNRALNRLAGQARGELLFFTDANAHIGAQCLKKMVRHFTDPHVGCVTGDSYSIEDPEKATIGRGASVYWGYESVLKRLESAVGSVLVCDGAIFCIRRGLFHPLYPELANDLELPLRIAHAGYWVLHEPQGQVFERDTSSPTQEYARRRRICAQGTLAVWKLRQTLRGLRAWQFFSHKILRWLTLIPLGLIFASSIVLARSWLFGSLLALQAGFYFAAFLGWVLTRWSRGTGRALAVPLYVVLGGFGALVGVYDACHGRIFDVWEIPTLSRGDNGPAAS